jgi:hypothetical protein
MVNIEKIYENVNNNFSIGKARSQKDSTRNMYNNRVYTTSYNPPNYNSNSGSNYNDYNYNKSGNSMKKIENFYENFNNKFSLNKKKKSKEFLKRETF